MDDRLTPEGKIVLRALETHRMHLQSHQCDQCLKSYETVVKSVTDRLNSKEEGSDGKEKERGQEVPKQTMNKESWNIF